MVLVLEVAVSGDDSGRHLFPPCQTPWPDLVCVIFLLITGWEEEAGRWDVCSGLRPVSESRDQTGPGPPVRRCVQETPGSRGALGQVLGASQGLWCLVGHVAVGSVGSGCGSGLRA